MRIVPLGDTAALVEVGDEAAAAGLARRLRETKPAWVVDVVLAYSNLAVLIDGTKARIADVEAWIATIPQSDQLAAPGRQVTIPCWYNGPDLESVARSKGLSTDEVVRLHCSAEYTVYAIGFCPGFPYLGYLPEPLTGVPRLPTPRLRVDAGSVGITGRQTGVYPLIRPGGWPLIGKTPMTLVDLSRQFFALAPGDRVRFESIPAREFEALVAAESGTRS